MPSEGALSGPGDAAGLIETFRWSPRAGFAFREEHLARLAASAAALGFGAPRGDVGAALAAFADGLPAAASRVRLVLARDGTMAITATPLPVGAQPPFRVALADARHRSDEPALRHKTTARDRYERPLARAAALLGADEVLFLNERDELCEGARTNLFLLRAGRLLTPPLACGLLPGTLRAHLLRTGQAGEQVLRLPDLAAAPAWFLGNSVRGLVPATLIEPSSARP